MSREHKPFKSATQLSTDAVIALTDLVESVHHTISRTGRERQASLRTRGITGLVYRSIRGITALSGRTLTLVLNQLEKDLSSADPSDKQLALLAVLNGVIGDYLANTENHLAIPMQLIEPPEPETTNQTPAILLIHGLCMNDRQWQRESHHHGQALQRDLNLTPIYLRYNSGKHISTNGRELAELLEARFQDSDQPLHILGHSMGGLVAHSACEHARQQGMSWLGNLEKLLFLGTPHQGAPLEKAGYWLETLWERNAYSAPLAKLARLRSDGITDLRHGHIRDEDWQADVSGATIPPAPLPDKVKCGAIAGQIDDRMHAWLGDGLVPVESALGHHTDPAFVIPIDPDAQWTCPNTGHLDLLSSECTYPLIREFFASPSEH